MHEEVPCMLCNPDNNLLQMLHPQRRQTVARSHVSRTAEWMCEMQHKGEASFLLTHSNEATVMPADHPKPSIPTFAALMICQRKMLTHRKTDSLQWHTNPTA
jgi:hypothetical protein